jgi:hypothetical protein
MTAVVLRDVVARITLDPLFALQVRTNPRRFAAAIKLTASETNTLQALLQPVSTAKALALRSDLARHAANEDVLMGRVRDLLARSQPADTASAAGVTPSAVDLERQLRAVGLTRRDPLSSLRRPGSSTAVGVGTVVGGVRGAGRGMQSLGRALQTAGGQIGGDTGKAVLRQRYRVRTHRDHLWSPSYFAGSCGGAPMSIIRQYVENQRRPD